MEEPKINWTTVKKKLSELKPNEGNPRKISAENAKRLREDLMRVGNFKPLIIDTNNIVLGGNQRYKELLKKHGGDYEVEVSYPDKELETDERLDVIILDNKERGEDVIELIGDEYNRRLAELGYTQVGMVDYEKMWEGMPSFDQDDDTPFKSVVVHFENQEHVDRFAKLVGQTITEKTKFIYYPSQQRENVKDLAYENEA
jgi:hypothetical protein